MAQKAFKVSANLKLNRLLIQITGQLTIDILKAVYTEVRFCVEDLKPGFEVISDISACTSGYLSAFSVFRKITHYLISKKVGRVVRVVGNTNVLLQQLIRLSARFQSYKPIYVLTLEEAEYELQAPVKQSNIRFSLHRTVADFATETRTASGHVVDLSISGCAIEVEDASILEDLGVDQEIMLDLQLMENNETPVMFSIATKLIWKSVSRFAVAFQSVSDTVQEQMHACLLFESTREVEIA